MIAVGYYSFEIGQEFDTGALGIGHVEGRKKGRLVVRLPSNCSTPLKKRGRKKVARCYYSEAALREHVIKHGVNFSKAVQLDMFGGAV